MNHPTPDVSWIGSVPPRLLAAFALLGALYVGLYSALFVRKIAEYFRDVLLAFEFARRWLDFLGL